jgi:hypothetical protein
MFTWFDLAWPWIGLAVAIGLVVLLFAGDALRGDPLVHRSSDLRWLAFLAIAAYLVHQFEEYGIAANGDVHAFPDALCAQLGQPAYPACPIPPAFFLAVNIPLVWVAAPVAALVARRSPLAGLTLCGVIAVNAVVHLVPSALAMRYEPGLLTAVLLFVPLVALMVAALARGDGRYRLRAAIVLVAAGGLMHAVLGIGLLLFLGGAISARTLIVLQPAGIAVGFLAVALADRHLTGLRVPAAARPSSPSVHGDPAHADSLHPNEPPDATATPAGRSR